MEIREDLIDPVIEKLDETVIIRDYDIAEQFMHLNRKKINEIIDVLNKRSEIG